MTRVTPRRPRDSSADANNFLFGVLFLFLNYLQEQQVWNFIPLSSKLLTELSFRICCVFSFVQQQFHLLSGQKRHPNELMRKDFAELSGELLGRFASKPLLYLVVPSNCSENSLVLFVRFFGFGVIFWPLILVASRNTSLYVVAQVKTEKATKEYLNHRGTKIRLFRVRFRALFLPPFFPLFFSLPPPPSPSGPVHSPTTSLLFASPWSPLFLLPEKSDLVSVAMPADSRREKKSSKLCLKLGVQNCEQVPVKNF